jgi:hypothetical protein
MVVNYGGVGKRTFGADFTACSFFVDFCKIKSVYDTNNIID